MLRRAPVLVPMDPMGAPVHYRRGDGYNKDRSIPSRPVLQLTGPLASTVPAFTTPYVHFPTSQSGTDVFNASDDHHNLQQCYELHDHSVYSSLCPTVSLIHTRIGLWNLFNFISPPQMDK
jgi:hypothetical protein